MPFWKGKSLAGFVDGFRPPFRCGGHKYYDSLLNQLDICPGYETEPAPRVELDRAWEVFRQTFIDECFNTGSPRKWTAVPFLDIVDSPCATGTVILCTNRQIKQKLSGMSKPAFFAGHASDFLPDDRRAYIGPIVPATSHLRWRNYFRVYQARHSEKAVMISLSVEDRCDIEDKINLNNIYIDLDNFEDTGFQHKYCFIVTKVITARNLKIEVTEDGEIFYEAEYKAAVPICFQAAKVRVLEESAGILRSIKPVTGVLKLHYRRKRNWQNFLNAFIPNQNRLGHSSGDFPNTMPAKKNPYQISYRPQILPRPNRRKNDLVWYFDTESEYRSIRYNFRRDWELNRRLWLDKAVDNDDDDDDDVIEPSAFRHYPAPERRSIEYEDFEW